MRKAGNPPNPLDAYVHKCGMRNPFNQSMFCSTDPAYSIVACPATWTSPKSCINAIETNVGGQRWWPRADSSPPGLNHTVQTQAGAQSPSPCSPAQPSQCNSMVKIPLLHPQCFKLCLLCPTKHWHRLFSWVSHLTSLFLPAFC